MKAYSHFLSSFLALSFAFLGITVTFPDLCLAGIQESLPEEINLHIMSLVDNDTTLISLSQTSSYWKNLAQDHTIQSRLQVALTLQENQNFYFKNRSKISMGYFKNCIITHQQEVRCWDDSSKLQFEFPEITKKTHLVSVGNFHACSIDLHDETHCWGDNKKNQLDIPEGAKHAKYLSAGAFHTCSLDFNHEVHCWGDNSKKQIEIPEAAKKARFLSVGAFHSCAIDFNSRVHCWGDSSSQNLEIPESARMAKYLSAGTFHTCIIDLNNLVQCWGKQQSIPFDFDQKVGKVNAIAAGLSHTCAIDQAQRVICWEHSHPVPFYVPTEKQNSIRAISMGGVRLCVLYSNDALDCWDNLKDPTQSLKMIRPSQIPEQSSCILF